MHQSFKDNTSPDIYRNKFFEFCDHYKDFYGLYSEWVSSFWTAHQHILGYLVPYNGEKNVKNVNI